MPKISLPRQAAIAWEKGDAKAFGDAMESLDPVNRSSPEALSEVLCEKAGELSPDMAAVMVRFGADPRRLFSVDDAAMLVDTLYMAISAANNGMVEWLSAQPDFDPNRRLPGALTPLAQALLDSHWEIADLLLSHGADPSYAQEFGATPLHVAASMYKVEAILWLIDNGANPGLENGIGNVPCECIPSTLDVGKGWNPDVVYEYLEQCRLLAAQGRPSPPLPAPVKDELLLEKHGLTVLDPQAPIPPDERERVKFLLQERNLVKKPGDSMRKLSPQALPRW